METLDWRNRRITVESLEGLSDCNIILNESQFEAPEFQQCIIRNGYYVSKLRLLFEEADARNIKFITPERAQEVKEYV